MNPGSYGPMEIILLARLLAQGRKPLSEAEVMKSVRPLLRGPTTRTSEAEQDLRVALTRLADDGLVVSGTMVLTPSGKKQARDELGLTGKTVPTQWGALKAILVELALGKRTRGPRGTSLTAGAIRATALARKLGIETSSTRPSDVLDAWAARELGMEGQRLTVANVRAFVLSRAIGIGALRDPKRIGSVAMAHVLGVPRTDAGTIRDAVLADWLTTSRSVGRTSLPRRRRPSVDDELRAFANDVKSAAVEATDGRFGRHKVFIGPIWERMRDARRGAAMNEDAFKEKLVEAHRAGLIRLSRADLTPAMAPELVSASEVSYLNAVFHFVDLEGTLS